MGAWINWGSVADWAAALASFGASVTALYLARSADRVRLRGFWGVRLVVGEGEIGEPPELLFVSVTNTGRRSAKITHTGIRWGLFKRHHGLIVKWDRNFSRELPALLDDGAEAGWGLRLDGKNDWFREQLFKEGVPSWLDVQATRFIVHTSAGAVLVLKPEKPLLKRLHQARKEILQAATAPA